MQHLDGSSDLYAQGVQHPFTLLSFLICFFLFDNRFSFDLIRFGVLNEGECKGIGVTWTLTSQDIKPFVPPHTLSYVNQRCDTTMCIR